MKNAVKAALVGVLFIGAAVMAATAVKNVAQQGSAENAEDNYDYAAFIGEKGDAEYYLRDCSGYVAVFKGESTDTPIEITDIETQTLNNVDRRLLADGIPAEDKNELLMLLEDLSS